MAQIQIDQTDMTALKSHLVDYDEWSADRDALSAAEGNGDYPPADSWHDSDDTAVEILRNIAELLKEALGGSS